MPRQDGNACSARRGTAPASAFVLRRAPLFGEIHARPRLNERITIQQLHDQWRGPPGPQSRTTSRNSSSSRTMADRPARWLNWRNRRSVFTRRAPSPRAPSRTPDRTGDPLGPRPEARANRSPVPAEIGRPSVAVQPPSFSAIGLDQLAGSGSADLTHCKGNSCGCGNHGQDDEAEAEDRPIECKTPARVNGSDGAERRQWRKSDSDDDRQQGTDEDRSSIPVS